MRWLADCLELIEDDHNHFARRAFGLTAKGRSPDRRKWADYLYFVGLARQYGHTLGGAVELAAKAFKKAPVTISDAVRGMTTHRPELFGRDTLEQVLLRHGRKLPAHPQIARKKGAKPLKRTAAKKLD